MPQLLSAEVVLCMHKTTILCQFGLKICHQSLTHISINSRPFSVRIVSEGTSNARTNDELLSIISEDPPGETVTLVVSKTDPITLLFIR